MGNVAQGISFPSPPNKRFSHLFDDHEPSRSLEIDKLNSPLESICWNDPPHRDLAKQSKNPINLSS